MSFIFKCVAVNSLNPQEIFVKNIAGKDTEEFNENIDNKFFNEIKFKEWTYSIKPVKSNKPFTFEEEGIIEDHI